VAKLLHSSQSKISGKISLKAEQKPLFMQNRLGKQFAGVLLQNAKKSPKMPYYFAKKLL